MLLRITVKTEHKNISYNVYVCVTCVPYKRGYTHNFFASYRAHVKYCSRIQVRSKGVLYRNRLLPIYQQILVFLNVMAILIIKALVV